MKQLMGISVRLLEPRLGIRSGQAAGHLVVSDKKSNINTNENQKSMVHNWLLIIHSAINLQVA
jgi:hypothetical protein